MMSKNLQRYYKLKCLIRDLLSNVFVSQNSDLPRFLIFRAVGGMRRVQISCDDSFRALFVLYEAELDNKLSYMMGNGLVRLLARREMMMIWWET